MVAGVVVGCCAVEADILGVIPSVVVAGVVGVRCSIEANILGVIPPVSVVVVGVVVG